LDLLIGISILIVPTLLFFIFLLRDKEKVIDALKDYFLMKIWAKKKKELFKRLASIYSLWQVQEHIGSSLELYHKIINVYHNLHAVVYGD